MFAGAVRYGINFLVSSGELIVFSVPRKSSREHAVSQAGIHG